MSDVVWAPRADAAAIADHLAGVLLRPGGSLVAMPGGTTPLPILEALATRDLGASEAEVMPTDDRLVPPDHEASNYGLLSRALAGSGLKISPLSEGATPGHFDLVWIGMGADGHVASIFPNAMDQLSSGRSVVATRPDPLPPEAPYDRVTLTIETLAEASEIVLVIRGAAKRALVEQAIRGETDLPITRLIASTTGRFTLYWSEA